MEFLDTFFLLYYLFLYLWLVDKAMEKDIHMYVCMKREFIYVCACVCECHALSLPLFALVSLVTLAYKKLTCT